MSEALRARMRALQLQCMGAWGVVLHWWKTEREYRREFKGLVRHIWNDKLSAAEKRAFWDNITDGIEYTFFAVLIGAIVGWFGEWTLQAAIDGGVNWTNFWICSVLMLRSLDKFYKDVFLAKRAEIVPRSVDADLAAERKRIEQVELAKFHASSAGQEVPTAEILRIVQEGIRREPPDSAPARP